MAGIVKINHSVRKKNQKIDAEYRSPCRALAGEALDENRIQFAAALERKNLSQASFILEDCRPGPDLPSMWTKLGKLAISDCDPHVALKAFGALGDIPKTRFFNKMIKRNSAKGREMYHDRSYWKSDYWTKANMLLLEGDDHQAVTIFYQNEDIDAAIEMYSNLHEFDVVFELIKTKHHPSKSRFVHELVAEWYVTEQYELLGCLADKVGNPDLAVCFILEAGNPKKAADYALRHPETLKNLALARTLAEALAANGYVEDAGRIYELTSQYAKAFDCYRKGKCYQRAVNLARIHFQFEVVPLEEEWGNHLMRLKDFDGASSHYIEAGNNMKALESAMMARQYLKAAQIIDTLEMTPVIMSYYITIGEFFRENGHFLEAEGCFVRARAPKRIIHMYTALERWGEAYKVACGYKNLRSEVHHHFLDLAKRFQSQGVMCKAEQILLAIGEVDLAITMFAEAKRYEEVLRLVEMYHPDHKFDTMLHLAEILVTENKFKEAEIQYIRVDQWERAVSMYESRKMWESAARVAKENGGNSAFRELIFRWSRILPPKSAVKLLTMHNYLEDYIVFAYKHGEFALAESIAEIGAPDKLPDVHLAWAQFLEESKNYSEAKMQYLKAGEPVLGVNMLINADCTQEAATFAEQYAKEELPRCHQLCAQQVREREGKFKVEGDDTPPEVEVIQAETLERMKCSTIDGQLDVMCEKNLWEQVLDRVNKIPELYAKYLGKYVQYVVKTHGPRAGLEVYVSEYGPSVHKLHLNLYRALANLIINNAERDDFETWKKFRDLLLKVLYGLKNAGCNTTTSKAYNLMEAYMFIMHLMAVKSVFKTIPQLEHLAAKAAISLLRFIHLVNPERAFYEAGTLCKQVKWENNALVFFNYYLDIRDAIAVGARTTGELQYAELKCTDIPNDVPLYSKHVVRDDWHDDLKEWVLAMSMDTTVPQKLTLDERHVFEGSLIADGKALQPCVLTGFPVKEDRVMFRTTVKYAIREDWSLCMLTCRGKNKDARLDNILDFIEKWAGCSASYF